jgi:GNAT superfamily N-acetyltransferase
MNSERDAVKLDFGARLTMQVRSGKQALVPHDRANVHLKIEQLSERRHLLPTVAGWIYNEWWTEVEGASVGSLSDLLQAHLLQDQIPITLVASLERCPVGTATLLAHDVKTEEWPDLSPWLAAVYVMPEYRRRGIGAALINAVVEKAAALGVGILYLSTVGREEIYADLGWQIIHRSEEKVVMSKSIAGTR